MDSSHDSTEAGNKAYEFFQRGNWHYHRGEYLDAIINLAASIELHKPTDYEAIWGTHGARGLAYYKISRFNEALADVTIAIDAATSRACSESLARLYYQRGMTYLALGNIAGHRDDFSRAYQHDPDRLLEPRQWKECVAEQN